MAKDSVVNSNEKRESDKSYRNDKKLLNISLWANRFSWIILFPYTINFLARGAFWFQALLPENDNGTFHYYLAQIPNSAYLWTTPVIGIIYFLILQTLSEGIRMLKDVDDKDLELIRILNLKRKNSASYIPLWANWFSWIILSISTIYFLASVANYFQTLLELLQSGSSSNYYYYLNEIATWSRMLVTPVTGIAYFLILQTISTGVLFVGERNT